MKKKPLSTYPNIPPQKVDQFTLPELINELFKNKQFNQGIQNLLSNCIVTSKSAIEQKPTPRPCTSKTHPQPPQSPLSSTTSSLHKPHPHRCTAITQPPSLQHSSTQLTSQDQCEFIFQHEVRNRMLYPWLLNDQNKQQIVECKLITDEIVQVIQDAIQVSLHTILNKEFINVTNQILAMREEINVFTKEELQRADQLRIELRRDMDKIEKKLQQQQHISTSLLSQPLEKFARSKGTLNSSNYSNPSAKQSNKLIQQNETNSSPSSSIHHDVFALKKQVDAIKKSLSLSSLAVNSLSTNKLSSQKTVNSQSIKILEEKIATNQDKLNELALVLKLSLEEHKQKWKKSHEKLTSQLATSTSKQYLSKEVKKTVQSNLKIYLDELMKSKKAIEDIHERIQKNDKGMQDYIGNQLKNLWTLVSGIKTRVQNIEDQFNVGLDQSFVL